MEGRLGRALTEYMAERSSPILVKQKSRGAGRSRTVKDVLILCLKIASAIIALAITTFGVYVARDTLLHARRFNVAIKEIHGLRYVPESHVLMRIREVEELNKNLLALDIYQLRKSIELLPWVKEAIVQRILPDKLVISIKERVPIAFARVERGTLLVDEDGILLENKPETLSTFDFPVVSGLETGFAAETLARNKKRIALYRDLIQSLDENGAGLSQDISEIYLQDTGNVSVIVSEDTVLVHLGAENFQEKFRRYLAMSRELKQKYPLLDSVDLRYSNQVVINTANQKLSH
jgi:cell division protein FtsQ